MRTHEKTFCSNSSSTGEVITKIGFVTPAIGPNIQETHKAYCTSTQYTQSLNQNLSFAGRLSFLDLFRPVLG